MFGNKQIAWLVTPGKGNSLTVLPNTIVKCHQAQDKTCEPFLLKIPANSLG